MVYNKGWKEVGKFCSNQSGWKQIDGDGGIWIAFFFRLLLLLLTTLRGHAGGNNSEYIWHSGLETGLIFLESNPQDHKRHESKEKVYGKQGNKGLLRGHAGGKNSEHIWHSGIKMGLILVESNPRNLQGARNKGKSV